MSAPVGVAVVGCGTISHEYLRNLTSFPDLRVLFCADLDLERAKAQAARYGVPGVGSTAQAAAHPDVELVVNLTIPAAHAEVTRRRWRRARASGPRNRSPSTPRPGRACSPRRTGPACWSAAPPTRCSAPGCRPPGG